MSRGYVLFHTVILLAAMSALAVRYAGKQYHAYWTADAEWKKTRALHAARSAVEMGRMLLESDSTAVDGPGDVWYAPQSLRFRDILAAFEIYDEQGKLNINHLLHPSMELNRKLWRIFQRLIPGERVTETAWKRFVSSGNRPVRLPAAGMLRWHPGLEQYDVGINFSVFGNGLINLNTASPDVLAALVNQNGAEFAGRIVEARSKRPFTSVFDMKQRLRLSEMEFKAILPVAAVRSSYFTVSAHATVSEVIAHVDVVIHRSGNATKIIQCREW